MAKNEKKKKRVLEVAKAKGTGPLRKPEKITITTFWGDWLLLLPAFALAGLMHACARAH